MYGLIGKMLANPGELEKLLTIMVGGAGDTAIGAMPGCLSYVVARDPTDENALWITEVWESAEAHKASLSLPTVQATINEARPLIAGFGERFETEPVGGYGL